MKTFSYLSFSLPVLLSTESLASKIVPGIYQAHIYCMKKKKFKSSASTEKHYTCYTLVIESNADL